MEKNQTVLISLFVILLFAASVSAEPYTKPVAISVGPTSQEIAWAKKNKNEEEYDSWVDHGIWYSYKAEEELRKLGIPVVFSKELEFEFSLHGKTHPWSLKKRKFQWSIILFNGVDPPREYEFVYDETMKPYFEKAAK
jgi:hypothetical protein